MRKAQVIYIRRTWGSKSKISECIFTELKYVQVTQSIKKDDEMSNCRLQKMRQRKWDKSLIRLLRRRSDKGTVMVGNELAVRTLGIENTLFHLRKREFQSSWETMVALLGGRNEGEWDVKNKEDRKSTGTRWENRTTNIRKSFLLVLSSAQWNAKELIALFEPVKNSYADIYIVMNDVSINIQRVVDYYFEEYGVELNIITYEAAQLLRVETVLFLLKEWRSDASCFCFQNGYAVVEWENEMKRKRLPYHLNEVDKWSGIYSGFAYEIEGQMLEYEEALVLMNYAYSFIGNAERKEEKPISVVAIYGVE